MNDLDTDLSISCKNVYRLEKNDYNAEDERKLVLFAVSV